MKIRNPIVLFFVLPIVAVLMAPPDIVTASAAATLFIVALVGVTGFFAFRGKSLALTFLIFLQGLNFIARMMLLFARAVSKSGMVDWTFIVTSILALALSFYLVFRLDEVDVRAALRG